MMSLRLPQYTGPRPAVFFESLSREHQCWIASLTRLFQYGACDDEVGLTVADSRLPLTHAVISHNSNRFKHYSQQYRSRQRRYQHFLWARNQHKTLATPAFWDKCYAVCPPQNYAKLQAIYGAWQKVSTFANFTSFSLLNIFDEIIPALNHYIDYGQLELKHRRKALSATQAAAIAVYFNELRCFVGELKSQLIQTMLARMQSGARFGSVYYDDITRDIIGQLQAVGCLGQYQCPFRPRFGITPMVYQRFVKLISQQNNAQLNRQLAQCAGLAASQYLRLIQYRDTNILMPIVLLADLPPHYNSVWSRWLFRRRHAFMVDLGAQTTLFCAINQLSGLSIPQTLHKVFELCLFERLSLKSAQLHAQISAEICQQSRFGWRGKMARKLVMLYQQFTRVILDKQMQVFDAVLNQLRDRKIIDDTDGLNSQQRQQLWDFAKSIVTSAKALNYQLERVNQKVVRLGELCQPRMPVAQYYLKCVTKLSRGVCLSPKAQRWLQAQQVLYQQSSHPVLEQACQKWQRAYQHLKTFCQSRVMNVPEADDAQFASRFFVQLLISATPQNQQRLSRFVYRFVLKLRHHQQALVPWEAMLSQIQDNNLLNNHDATRYCERMLSHSRYNKLRRSCYQKIQAVLQAISPTSAVRSAFEQASKRQAGNLQCRVKFSMAERQVLKTATHPEVAQLVRLSGIFIYQQQQPQGEHKTVEQLAVASAAASRCFS